MRFFTVPPVGERASAGLLLIRLIVGVAFVIHGFPKVQHATAWMGETSPFPPALLAVAAYAEFLGGIALILGVLTSLAALLIAIDMAVAIFVVEIPHGTPFVSASHSYESAAFYMIITLALLFTGPGRFSVDAMMRAQTASRRARLSHA